MKSMCKLTGWRFPQTMNATYIVVGNKEVVILPQIQKLVNGDPNEEARKLYVKVSRATQCYACRSTNLADKSNLIGSSDI